MTAFPRTVTPFQVSEFEIPGPLISKAQSGRVNLRATQQAGRTWKEQYLLKVTDTTHRAFLATVRDLWRNGTIFTIGHVDYATSKGSGGGTPLVNSATNLVTDPENFGAWTLGGTPIRTSGQSDPLGGTAAYLLEDDAAGAAESLNETVTFTGNATKAFSVYMKQGSSDDSAFALWDSTAGTYRHAVNVTWAAGVPTLSTASGAGALFTPEQVGTSAWYRLSANATGVIAANTNQMFVYPTRIVSGDVGTTYVFGANAWNETTPARYSGPSQTGTAQTGANLYINGGTASTANWLRAGDIFTVAGLSPAYELTASVTTQSDGYAILPINPPIFTGGSPADNAALTITGVTLNAVILEPPDFPDSSGNSSDYGTLGLTFSESL